MGRLFARDGTRAFWGGGWFRLACGFGLVKRK